MKFNLSSKSQVIKIASIVLASMIVGGSVSVLSFAAITKNKDNNSSSDTSTSVDSQEKDDNKDLSKDQTVYVLANADGSVKKVIVSNWIKNAASANKITDNTSLKDIKNVKGDEKYTMDSDNLCVWDAEGDDIYYQGTSDKDVPVDLSVSYKLDGKTVSPDELAGKSGKVAIRFDYTNKQYENVSIDGKDTKIYVPYVMLTGLLVDNDVFRNVNVTNGKIINDGNHTIVAGLALPGMQENLAIDKDEFEIPSYIEINADVTDFELGTTMTLATNSVFNEIDTSKLDDVSDIESSMSSLKDAMTKLLDGSSKLYGGLTQLLSKSNELVAGVNKLADGANSADAGAKTLNDGLKTLVSKNADLNGGANQVFGSLLTTVKTQIAANGIAIDDLTIENYSTVLNSLIENPTDAQKAQLIAIANAQIEEKLAENKVPADYYNTVKVLLADEMTAGATQDAAMSKISTMLTDAATVQTVGASDKIAPDPSVFAYLRGNGYDPQTAGLIAKICTYLVSVNGGNGTDYIEKAADKATNAQTVAAAAADTNAALKVNGLCLKLAGETLNPTVKAAIDQLDSYNTFYQGVLKYTAGVKEACDGSDKLKDGTAQLAGGLSDLQKGSGALVDGVKQLDDGAMQLSDGLKEFNEKGVKKLTDMVGDNIGGLVSRIKATVDVSKNYKAFDGAVDGVDGSVKFIYKTDEIKK